MKSHDKMTVALFIVNVFFMVLNILVVLSGAGGISNAVVGFINFLAVIALGLTLWS